MTIKSPGHHDDDDTSYHCNMFVGATISMWHRQENKVETLYNLFEWIMPSKYAPGVASNIAVWNDQSDMYCAGDLTTNAGSDASWLDYHHVSSVSAGPDGDVLVALRNLHTLVALAANGSGPLWVVSSAFSREQLRATFPATATLFAFARDADKFYEPHSAQRLASGNVLLVDDGRSRPGCAAVNGYKGCYSRALELALDWRNQTVAARWQFADPYTLNELEAWGEEAGLTSEEAGEAGWLQAMTKDQFNRDGVRRPLLRRAAPRAASAPRKSDARADGIAVSLPFPRARPPHLSLSPSLSLPVPFARRARRTSSRTTTCSSRSRRRTRRASSTRTARCTRGRSRAIRARRRRRSSCRAPPATRARAATA